MVLLLLVVVVVALITLHNRLTRAERTIELLRRELAGVGEPTAPIPPVGSPDPAARPLVPAPDSVPVPPRHDHSEDVERAIGERWLLYAGIVLLLLAVAFFLRYAFDRNWLSPVVRVGLGAAAGVGLASGGRRLAAAGFRTYGLIVAGAGIAALYLSTYAALNYYELLSPGVAFALLIVISAAAAWMADRDVAPALAVVAVCGGYATPFLVGSGQDAQITLFTYVAVLIAAITWLAMRRDWWYLDLLSFAFTIATVASWFVAFYATSKAIRTELFLTLYCTMFLVILRGSLRWGSAHAREGARLLLAAPVLYHLASIAILAPHHEAFLTYLILATTAALLIADRTGSSWLRAIAWVVVALPLAGWLDARSGSWVTASIACVAAVYVAHLAAQVNAVRTDEPIRAPDLIVVHANGLGVYGALVIILESRGPQLMAAIAIGLAAWNAVLALVAHRRRLDIALHLTAVAATLAAIAAAWQFDGPWVVVMWAVEAAAVIAIAVRSGRDWFRVAGWALMLIAVLRWIAPDVQDTSITAPVLLNARALSGLLIVGLLYGLAWWQTGRRGAGTPSVRIELALALLGASALTVALISREIIVYWDVRALRGEVVYIARQAMLSAAWAIYAAMAIAVGMRRAYAPLRYFGIALFGVTLVKVFVVDLSTLAGIYRIAAFFIIGVVLLFASFLYQRQRS